MKRMLFILLITNISLFCHGLTCSVALEKPTHRNINEFIADNEMNGFNFDSYLKSNLGFSKGKDETLKSGKKTKKILNLLGDGGEMEDDTIARSTKHFHNPLENNLADAGLWGGESAVLWAQYPIGYQSTQGRDYSWHDTRDYFIKALISESEDDKQEYFSKTFMGIGHLMHLVTDMSVPEHTRDDAHVLGAAKLVTHYEQWVKKNIPTVDDVGSYPPVFCDSTSLPNPSQFTAAPVPIANLFDTNQYQMGDHPYVTVNNPTIGLSEYTNANFLSPDTMFTTDFPYPSVDECSVYPDLDLNRWYVRNDIGLTGERIEHLAVVSYLYFWRHRNFPNERINRPIGLDRHCYEEYASHLIPRAVGYSANLMEYFFRGQLEITAPDDFVYGIIDGSSNPQQFTKIKAKIKNISPREKDNQGNIISYDAIGSGEVRAVVRYKMIPDYQPDLTKLLLEDEMRLVDYSYSVSSSNDIGGISHDAPEELLFDFVDDPIPAGVTDLCLFVIFKGTLGNEADNAVAVGMKDLNEPEHLAYWNNTDYFQLNGELKKAGEISTFYGYIYPHDISEELTFYGNNQNPDTASVVATIQDLPPERYSRIIILIDDPNGFRVKDQVTSNGESFVYLYDFTSAIDQQDADGFYSTFTTIYSTRGIYHHQMSYYIRCFPDFEYHPEDFPDVVNDPGPYPLTINFP